MTSTAIDLRHFRDIEPAWDTLIDLYAEVRADKLHDPHYSVERYAERLARHAHEPGWEAVIGYDGDEAVGYAYANTVEQDDRYWKRITTPLADSVTAVPTLALKEIGVRVPWRKTGVSKAIHDSLLAARSETQATLMVNPLAGDGKVHNLYVSWGYGDLGESQPSPDSPVLVAMVRALP
ncbi:putative acetyltransferase [Actinacidiphila reveromycinica]|uniref:Putative acetyltransferase n=1 Tax=Actinacidiphila reveromycinica TaxID=659352 RepID=A0A7U3UUM1_9ACTN|nr:GNAT family N-acetyltransferase [Streptomyces sp. SN-593]BBA99059.1 putative acetyltransferase [Streptomyces sp. SN-593]